MESSGVTSESTLVSLGISIRIMSSSTALTPAVSIKSASVCVSPAVMEIGVERLNATKCVAEPDAQLDTSSCFTVLVADNAELELLERLYRVKSLPVSVEQLFQPLPLLS